MFLLLFCILVLCCMLLLPLFLILFCNQELFCNLNIQSFYNNTMLLMKYVLHKNIVLKSIQLLYNNTILFCKLENISKLCLFGNKRNKDNKSILCVYSKLCL